nr:class I SAM-dependent methyltransferase [Asticcacaulis solisilvae]
MARIHGLDAAPVETARVLEIGGGDGANVIAMAAAYPDGRFLNFDLAASAVARGQALLKEAGLTNVRVEVGDILDAAESLTETFDYIIVHGVYAWVPEPVREAIWKIIGRCLAAEGVAYISYNALPGGHVRKLLRDMILRHVEGLPDAERTAAAREFLTAYAAPRDDDRPLQTGLRGEAANMLDKPPEVLYHDELGPCFEPQSLTDMAQAAGHHGMQYLNEAHPGLLADGFISEAGDSTKVRDIVAAVQRRDDDIVRFFRHSLFVRAEAKPERRLDPARIMSSHVSARCTRDGQKFTSKDGEFVISNEGLAEILDKLSASWPRRFRIDELTDQEPYAHALFRLFDFGLTQLHGGPAPFSDTPGDRPKVSALARAMIRQGYPMMYTLDHRTQNITEDEPRAFVLGLDGRSDVVDLKAGWTSEALSFEAAMTMVVESGLLQP